MHGQVECLESKRVVRPGAILQGGSEQAQLARGRTGSPAENKKQDPVFTDNLQATEIVDIVQLERTGQCREIDDNSQSHQQEKSDHCIFYVGVPVHQSDMIIK